ncbi:VWA domain-containing protein [Pseudonocardia sp. WMMC193]|uniref:vWA domain-containing protein n=1 Tax=Pseudonocardia sp. WMMC193 TaxID=2911965 RepID=UPI001F32DAA4|nr:VWA domain-containing protein [Pseudonocardia sp. WMMC193]MCF7553266.1 VWA domain-containing protein [Pseudonocardia sp. WMMC193]
MPDPPDLPALAARFVTACRAAGLPGGADRAERFTRAVLAVGPATMPRLHACARATLVSGPDQLEVLDRVFASVFGDPLDDVSPDVRRGDPGGDPSRDPPDAAARQPERGAAAPSAGGGPGDLTRAGASDLRETAVPVWGSAAEQLATRDFADLDPDELAQLADLMSRLRIVLPVRRSRRTRRAAHGDRVDMRRTLADARRTAGHPVILARRSPRVRPRRLVVLCDISGSMAPYARAVLLLLSSAAGTERAEVFTFATRLTRLTAALRRGTPGVALRRAAALVPDWSGGTRIAPALAELQRFRGGAAVRGAVVLIVSDGWETGDPAALGLRMALLRRRAHRVVWANPRTADPRYRPLAGGMAAAWPYCDVVVSAHDLRALADLVDALGEDRSGQRRVAPRRGGDL